MPVTKMGENFSPIRRAIKNNNIFLVTDANGNVISNNTSGYGLYTDDTRFLSRLELKLNDSEGIILSSSTETGHSSVVIATNSTINDTLDPDRIIPQESVQIKRESIIYGSYFETITLSNYNLHTIGLKLDLFFESDFLDIFEVRNIASVVHGERLKPIFEDGILKYVYHDTTGATLSTEIEFIDSLPTTIQNGNVVFDLTLEPAGEKVIKYQIRPRSTASFPEKLYAYDFNDAFEKTLKQEKASKEKFAFFITDNEDFNELLSSGVKDINMLVTKAHYGEYIAAGIPWFTTLLGRDSLITGRQTLMLCPGLAKNILLTVANFQGKQENPWKDEEPGKMPHEIRFGELARSNIIPNGTYYGSVDSTSLWLMLLYDYYKWTNDTETIKKLWPNVIDCVKWILNNLKITGYASYLKKSANGLNNQGWKNSDNSNIHIDGSLAQPPISIVEAQGYTYAALSRTAELAAFMKNNELKEKLLKTAGDLKKRFNNDFWMEEKQFFALGLDKDGKQMQSITSNPGHCLETGIINEEYLNIVAERFFEPDMFSGWGIRTLSKYDKLYNPMSYHNGSIWPHDNSIIALGLSKIGRTDLVNRIISALFEASRLIEYKRLPELFCGFSRIYKRLDPPVKYPLSCSPQGWAAASIYLSLQAILCIFPDAQKNELLINNAIIPNWISYLKIDNLRIGNSAIDAEFRKTSNGFVLDVLEKRGNIDIIIKK
ncbi:MAG: glycogen debranching N-terminal domain-containing protein [Candidatus Gastranaerophilaceae bacterium]|jgi:glycogen debranching enzyme